MAKYKWATTWQNQQSDCAPSEVLPVRPESSLPAWRKLGSLATHSAHSEDSDQTGRMSRLIWVFAGRTLILLVLSCRGSNVHTIKRNRMAIIICKHKIELRSFGKVCNKIDRWIKEYLKCIPKLYEMMYPWRVFDHFTTHVYNLYIFTAAQSKAQTDYFVKIRAKRNNMHNKEHISIIKRLFAQQR